MILRILDDQCQLYSFISAIIYVQPLKCFEHFVILYGSSLSTAFKVKPDLAYLT